MVQGFLKGILSPSRHLELKEGPCECVRVTTWVACLLLESICFSLVATVTRTADYRDGVTCLSEVSLSQFWGLWSESPWLAEFWAGFWKSGQSLQKIKKSIVAFHNWTNGWEIGMIIIRLLVNYAFIAAPKRYVQCCKDCILYWGCKNEHDSEAKLKSKECWSLKLDSDPSTWMGSWQRKTGCICDCDFSCLEDDPTVRTLCFITKCDSNPAVGSTRALSVLTLPRESDLLQGPRPGMWILLSGPTVVGKGSKMSRWGMLTDTNKQVVLGPSQRVGCESTVGAWGWLASRLLS